jgi:ABC-type phosphate/phosphonate transport system substrate-binding protein
MKKLLIGTALALGLLFSGCVESEESKAKTEFKQAMLSIKPETFIKEWTETKDMFEKKYGQDVNVWFQELKQTNEWKALDSKAKQMTMGKVLKY